MLETVFNRNYPIPLYLVCANLMKLIDREVRTDKHALDRKDQTNVRFYAAMHLASLATGKTVPTPARHCGDFCLIDNRCHVGRVGEVCLRGL
jgi:hypothetical protein